MHCLFALQCAYGNAYYASILKPFLIIFLWYGVSMLLAVLNNWYMEVDGFDFPLYLSMSHMIVTFLGAYIIKHSGWYTALYFGRGSDDDETLRDYYRGFATWKSAVLNVGVMSVLMAVWLSLYNLSLDYIDINSLQVISSSGVLIVLAASLALKQETLNFMVIFSVCAIVGGVIYSNYDEMKGELLGFVFAVLSTTASALNVVLVYKMLKPVSTDFVYHTPLDLLVYFSIPVLILLIAPFCVFELQKVLHQQNDFAYFYTLIIVAAESVLYFLATWIAFTIISMTSAITFQILGILRQVFVFLAALLFFRERLTLSNIVGNSVVLFGISVYALARAGAFTKLYAHYIESQQVTESVSNRSSLASVESFEPENGWAL